LSSVECFGLPVEKIHEGQLSAGNLFLSVVTVMSEEVTVVSGSDLRLHAGNGERFHSQLFQNPGQRRLYAADDYIPVFAQIHHHARTPILRIDDPALDPRGNDLADVERVLLLERKARQLLQFLRRQKLVQEDAFRT